MKIGKRLAAALGVAAVAGGVLLAVAAPASAHHNSVAVRHVIGDCGLTTFYTGWQEGTHQTSSTVLVVRVNGEVHTAPVGEELTVGPFDAERAVIQWRVWGGGERDYDNPAVFDLDALLEHLEGGGSPLDADAPGLAWHDLPVGGCVPPSPSPEPSPTVEPSPEPSPSVGPSASPSAEPSESPAPGEGGGSAEGELAVTGSPVVPLVGVGLVALAVGVAIVYALRRKRPTFTA